jgi:hypothetical protein
MRQTLVVEFVVVAFILVVGPLAVLFGTDSRLDEADRRRRWYGIG